MAHDDSKLERLTDLILALLDAPTPLPLSQLAEEIPGYPPEPGEARRMAFERDKRLLREEGIVVQSVPIDGPEQYGYRIDPTTFFLPDLDLDPDEQAALHLAVAGVHLSDDSGGDALRKLGVVELSDVQPVATLGAVAGLDRLFQAISSVAEVRFDYRGEQRAVAPVRLRFSGGHWYLTGWSKERQAPRNYRVDRIEGTISLGAAGTGRVPEGASVIVDAPDEPWLDEASTSPATTLRLWVDPLYAWRVVAEAGDSTVVERHKDGSVILEVAVGREEAVRSWVLSFLDHVEILEPPELRAGLVAWLEAVIAAARTTAESMSLDDFPPPTVGEDAAKAVPPTQRRLRRLLAILEWLAGVGSAPTAEVAERFNMTPAEVVAELELAACCGRPPFSPGELMDIVVDADIVEARLPEMSRPRQLTPAEGVALAAAARTILALPGADGAGSLARALDKLDAALGERRAVEVALDKPPFLTAVSDAASAGRSIEVEYLSTSTDELTTRVIDPLRVISTEGRWYVEAWCHRAGAPRTFRIDQLKRVTDVGLQENQHALLAPPPTSFIPAADAAATFVHVGQGALWMTDSIPILGRRSEPDGTTTIAVSVSGPAWFERVMLQGGPDAVIVAPVEQLSTAADAAARVLGRYRPTV